MVIVKPNFQKLGLSRKCGRGLNCELLLTEALGDESFLVKAVGTIDVN